MLKVFMGTQGQGIYCRLGRGEDRQSMVFLEKVATEPTLRMCQSSQEKNMRRRFLNWENGYELSADGMGTGKSHKHFCHK